MSFRVYMWDSSAAPAKEIVSSVVIFCVCTVVPLTITYVRKKFKTDVFYHWGTAEPRWPLFRFLLHMNRTLMP